MARRAPAPDQGQDFWSARRARVEAEAKAEQTAAAASERAEQDAKLAERSDEEILGALNLPMPEALDSPDAVQDFLKSAVPQRLKTRALRKLWTLNPIFGQLDGLVDYGEDFTDSAMVVENMQTAYQVGKGMLKAFVEETPEDSAPAHDEDLQGSDEALAQDDEGLKGPEETQTAARVDTPDAPLAPLDDPAPLAASRRRMRFAFDQPDKDGHA